MTPKASRRPSSREVGRAEGELASETERKFLVRGDGWKGDVTGSRTIVQAYVATTPAVVIRVRISDDEKATLTLKSAEPGMTRSEFEYDIPLKDARALLKLRTGNTIEKRRHIVPAGSLAWEIDVFGGAHHGLVMAEIELPSQETPFERPDWLGEEVTADRRYYNASLALGEAAEE